MNETTLTKVADTQLSVPSDVSAGAMAAALAGDLSKLTEQDKLKFVGALCEFTGLNPLAKPFDWIVLNGKLTLYANKGCAEQLRKIHKVTIEILERKTESGVHIVRVKGTDHSGRTDESIGAVPFDDKMGALDKANAFMKAETKAKRRVSLSICGLGMIDESELDQVKHAKPVTEVVATESATAIADEVNALNKPKVQDAEIVQPAAKVETVKAEPIIDVEFGQSEPTQAVATAPGQLSPADKMARELEIVLSEFKNRASMLDIVAYCVRQGKLDAGAAGDLSKLDAAYGARLLAKPVAFIGAVETWVKGGKK